MLEWNVSASINTNFDLVSIGSFVDQSNRNNYIFILTFNRFSY